MPVSLRRVIPVLFAVGLLAGLRTGAAQAQVAVVVGERAMPAPIVEVVPAVRPGFSWVPGHWIWRRGAWFWVKGHHARGIIAPMPAPIVEVVPVRPSPAHIWVKGHHGWEGGRWVWRPGVWVRL
jgi:WXXGXW repeat (2 copies)